MWRMENGKQVQMTPEEEQAWQDRAAADTAKKQQKQDELDKKRARQNVIKTRLLLSEADRKLLVEDLYG